MPFVHPDALRLESLLYSPGAAARLVFKEPGTEPRECDPTTARSLWEAFAFMLYPCQLWSLADAEPIEMGHDTAMFTVDRLQSCGVLAETQHQLSILLTHEAEGIAEHVFEGIFFQGSTLSTDFSVEVQKDSDLAEGGNKSAALLLHSRASQVTIALLPSVCPHTPKRRFVQWCVGSMDEDTWHSHFDLREALIDAARIMVGEHIRRRASSLPARATFSQQPPFDAVA